MFVFLLVDGVFGENFFKYKMAKFFFDEFLYCFYEVVCGAEYVFVFSRLSKGFC